MMLQEIDHNNRLDLARDSVIVGLYVSGTYDRSIQCIHSFLKHTSPEIPLLVADADSSDSRVHKILVEIDGSDAQKRQIYYLRPQPNIGFAVTVNSVLDITEDADIVILNSNCVVADGWLDSLRRVADSDSQVATVSTLTNNGAILSVPYRNRPIPVLPEEWSIEKAAAAVRENAPNINAQIPAGIDHCLYIRRSAVDVVGDFDETLSPDNGVVDFCQRCVLIGLKHVVADDVLVLRYEQSVPETRRDGEDAKQRQDAVISSRYPYYSDWMREAEVSTTTPLARSISAASTALSGVSVTIDGRCLSTFVTGTCVYTLELISSLSKISDVHLRVVVPNNLDDDAGAALDSNRIELLREDAVNERLERTNIVHRPYQLAFPEDIQFLEKLGERLVLTQLDMIAYTNPGYHTSLEEWRRYQRLIRTGFMLADQVVFISRHAANTAIGEDLIDPDRATVVYPGTDHLKTSPQVTTHKPARLDGLSSKTFLLCLGTDFRHKNRRFALQMLEALIKGHGWEGSLVFAGMHVISGSSAGEEAEYLTKHSELDSRVIDIAAVDTLEKDWLCKEAAAILYPSLYEGFGFLPFEAAYAGVPCLFASHSSLKELLPGGVAMLTKWNAGESARRVFEVLNDVEKRHELVGELKEAAEKYNWNRAGSELLDLYKRTCSLPVSNGGELRAEFSRQKDALERQLVELRHRTELDSYSNIDKALVGHQGVIPSDLRRALLGAWNRKLIRVIVFWPIAAFYRTIYFLRHRKSARKQFNE